MAFSTIQPIISGILFLVAFILWYKVEKEGHKHPFLVGLIIALGFPFIISAFSFLPDPNSIRLVLQKVIFVVLCIILLFVSYKKYQKQEIMIEKPIKKKKDKKIEIEEIKIPKDPEIVSKSLDLKKRERDVKKKEIKLTKKEEKIDHSFKKLSEKENELRTLEKELKKVRETLENEKLDLENNKEDLGILKSRKEKELKKLEKRKEKLLNLEKELSEELKKVKSNV